MTHGQLSNGLEALHRRPQARRNFDGSQWMQPGMDRYHGGANAFHAARLADDPHRDRAPAELRDGELEGNHVAERIRREKPAFALHRRKPMAAAYEGGVVLAEPLGEPVLHQLVEEHEVLRVEDDARGVAVVEAHALLAAEDVTHQPKRTYSNATGWLSMPVAGSAIQPANFPGSTTRPMRDATKARSSAVGSHSSTRAFHCASESTSPAGDTFTPASVPMRRLNALCGRTRHCVTPVFAMRLFQRSTPPSESRTKSSRSTSFSAFSIGTRRVASRPSFTSRIS